VVRELPLYDRCYGSAPKYAGKNIVNPSAMFLTIAMLLDRFGYNQDAIKIRSAIHKVVSDNKCVTYDLGGQASTSEMATSIIEYATSDHYSQYKHNQDTYKTAQANKPVTQSATKSIAIIATGNELVKGEILDTNGQYFAQKLALSAIDVQSQQLVIDDQHLIEQELQRRLLEHDCVILCGGLGPTSDDKTRFAVATVAKKPLIFSQEQWDYICQRLTGFNLTVHESNRQQAMFPAGATILPNYNGTAAGCWLEIDNKLVVMLPGPPKECRPLFDQHIMPELLKRGFVTQVQQLYWKLIGVIEADIAAIVDDIVSKLHHAMGNAVETSNMMKIDTGYRLNYPYLDVKISHNLENVEDIEQIFNLISTALASHKVTTIPNKTSIDLLRESVASHPDTIIYINDQLTQGVFASVIGHLDNVQYSDTYYNDATNYQSLKYVDSNTTQEANSKNVLHMTATGLDSFHQGLPCSGVEYLCCTIDDSTSKVIFNKKIEIPYRGKEVLDYAVHFMAYCLYQALTSDN
jgi:isocitrate dehydrogenase